MVVLLHGAAGGLDEIAIAAAALGVLWLAVRLAGRKPAGEDEAEEAEGAEVAAESEHEEPAKPTPTMKSD